jgi:type IV pilus assembly protein PilQ
MTVLLLCASLGPIVCLAGQPVPPSLLDYDNLPTNANALVETLNVGDADIRDVLRAVAERYDVNLVIDNSIRLNVTAKLSKIPVVDLLTFLCAENDLLLDASNGVFRITSRPQPAAEPPPPIDLRVRNNLLSGQLDNVPLSRLVESVQRQAGISIVVTPGTDASLSGYLTDVPLIEGLSTLLNQHGLSVAAAGNVFVIATREGGQTPANLSQSLQLDRNAGGFDIKAVNAPLRTILAELAAKTADGGVALYVPIGSERVTVTLSGASVEDVLVAVLRGTPYTFTDLDGNYMIGSGDDLSFKLERLVRLKHARVDQLIENLPASITSTVEIVVIKELNALMLVGKAADIIDIKDFIDLIDKPTPQILIEALVVDFETTDLSELGVTLGRGGGFAEDGSFAPYSLFGGGDDQGGGLTYQGDGAEANSFLRYWKDLLGVGVGNLPTDFIFRIQALEREGKAKIVSRPQIATINGNTARISIGTTQYYILTSTTPLQSPNQIITQESERFERIEANVSLEITPWVTSTGEVTVEVHPEFSTPVGGLSPGVPPTINSRVLDSTVRLRDGETIILGGLIQESDEHTVNKVPILGNIPLIGRLFRNKRTTKRKSELVIYITPHIFDGSADAEKWQQLSGFFGNEPNEHVRFLGDPLGKDSTSVRSNIIGPNVAPAEDGSNPANSDAEVKKQ